MTKAKGQTGMKAGGFVCMSLWLGAAKPRRNLGLQAAQHDVVPARHGVHLHQEQRR